MSRELPSGRWGADALAVGDWLRTGEVEITAAQIDAFADLTGDRFEIHMDDAAAQRHGFPRRVAHGLLVLGLIDGLKAQAPAQFNAMASLGWDWSFRAPVFIGDRIHVIIAVEDKRATRNPERCVLKLGVKAAAADGRLVQSGVNLLMAYQT